MNKLYSLVVAVFSLTLSLGVQAEKLENNLINMAQPTTALSKQIDNLEVIGESEPKDGSSLAIIAGLAAAGYGAYELADLDELDDEEYNYLDETYGDGSSSSAKSKICGASSCPSNTENQVLYQFQAADVYYNSYVSCLKSYSASQCASDYDNHQAQCNYAQQVDATTSTSGYAVCN